jgi:hypothetical protein
LVGCLPKIDAKTHILIRYLKPTRQLANHSLVSYIIILLIYCCLSMFYIKYRIWIIAYDILVNLPFSNLIQLWKMVPLQMIDLF